MVNSHNGHRPLAVLKKVSLIIIIRIVVFLLFFEGVLLEFLHRGHKGILLVIIPTPVEEIGH